MTLALLAALGLVCLLLLMAAAVNWRRGRRSSSARLYPRLILEPDAQVLHARLRNALPQYFIFAQASLGRFLEAKAPSRELAARRQLELDGHCADFLICGSDFRTVAAVELADVLKTRRGGERARQLLREAGVPVLNWNTVNLPTVRDIQEAVAELETLRLISLSHDEPDLPRWLALNPPRREGRREQRL